MAFTGSTAIGIIPCLALPGKVEFVKTSGAVMSSLL